MERCGFKTKEELNLYINQIGITKFLKDNLTADILADFCNAYDKNYQMENFKEIADEIMLNGMQIWLESFPQELLIDFCKGLSISFNQSDNEDIIDSIMVKIFNLKPKTEVEQLKDEDEEASKSEESERSTPKKSKRMKSSSETPKSKKGSQDGEKGNTEEREENNSDSNEKIRKRPREHSGVSPSHSEEEPDKKRNKSPASTINKNMPQEELETFTLRDLQKFCKKYKVPYTGKKSEVVARLKKFLDTGERPWKRKNAGRKKRGK